MIIKGLSGTQDVQISNIPDGTVFTGILGVGYSDVRLFQKFGNNCIVVIGKSSGSSYSSLGNCTIKQYREVKSLTVEY